MKKTKKPKKPSVIAMDLRTPKYRKRVVKMKTVYTRKGRTSKDYGPDYLLLSVFAEALLVPAELSGSLA